jgi:ribosomal protein S18 acetylase RimI-like enzyme
MHLYRAAEFKPVGRRRDYYSGGNGARFDALTLSRSI